MNSTLLTQFMYGIRWNFIESILYQMLFLFHHIALYRTLDSVTYGTVGILFSLLYLTVALVNLGLDHSIAVFYPLCTKSKQHFRAILAPHCITHVAILILLALFSFLFGSAYINHYFTIEVSFLTLVCLTLLVISEAIKKTLRTLLQFAFMNKVTTLVEVTYFFLYLILIWGSYYFGKELNTHTILVPFLLTSLASTTLLALHLLKWYQTLPPSHPDPLPHNLQKRFIFNRIMNSINNIGRHLFTNNFIVALFALKFGIPLAGTAKFIGSFSEFLGTLINKTFSRMSNALLSQTRHKSIEEKKETFSFLTYTIHQSIYCSLIMLIINYQIIQKFNSTQTALSWSSLVLLLILPLLDHLFIAYEKFFITEERTDYLIAFNIIAIALLYMVMYSPFSSPFFILSALFAIKLVVFCMMNYVAYQYWSLKPNWNTHPKLIFGVTVASFIIFIMLR